MDDLKDIAELMSLLRVIMEDNGQPLEKVYEMEEVFLSTWGIEVNSSQGRAIIAWSYLHPAE